MKIRFALTTILALLSLANLALAFDASLTQEQENIYPHIVEYIPKFEISTNDLANVLDNQLHSIKLGDINTSYAHVLNSTVSISHYESDKRVEYINPLKVSVANDSFTVFVMFSIHVVHIVGGKNYTCNTSIPLVYVSYIKELNLQTGDVIISSLKSTYSSKSFKEPVCKETESAKDKVRIDEVVNSTEGQSIYLQLLKSFQKMQEYFTVNAKGEHLSKIYPSNPYEYGFQNDFKISVNVGTLEAVKFGENGVENKISGAIAGTTAAAIAPPQYEEGYTSFYSVQFFQNLLEYTKNNYAKWKSIKLNRNNMRTRIFKFRLIDFEYIIPSILRKYPQKYLSDIEIECSMEKIKDFIIAPNNFEQLIDWRCIGSLQVEAGKRETFLNFVATAKHTLKVSADQTRLFVYVDSLQIVGINFDIIGDHVIVDPFTFAAHVNECLFEFRVYTIGSNLKVSSPKKLLKAVAGQGIWVG